jgi:hypothetical protein
VIIFPAKKEKNSREAQLKIKRFGKNQGKDKRNKI